MKMTRSRQEALEQRWLCHGQAVVPLCSLPTRLL